MIKGNKGFTLIELLVVIAIIGILSSVVLASLNTARDKGANAAVKANLSNTRAQAELFYDTVSNYEGVCATTGDSTIGVAVNAAEVAAGVGPTGYVDATASTFTTGQCHDSTGSWAAWVPLKDTADIAWCVDSNGASKQVTAVLASNAVICP